MRSFAQSLPMGLLRAREATMARFRPLLSEHGVTEQQWRVLRALSSVPAGSPLGVDGALEVGEIADRTFLLGPSLSRMLSHLDERGLIERATAAADQRRTLVSLTAEGQELVRTIAPHSEAAYNRIEADFGADRLGALLNELAALEAALADQPGQ